MGDTKGPLKPDSGLLRELADRDSDLLFQWINDRDLVILNAPFRPVSAAEHSAWFAGIRQREDLKIFAIAEPSSGRTIGYCQLKKIDRQRGDAELQIRIGDKALHGKGLGTAAVRELLRFAFEDLKLQRIRLQVFQENVRAYRSYVKCGFKVEGILREAVQVEGKLKDIAEMVLLRRDYLAARR